MLVLFGLLLPVLLGVVGLLYSFGSILIQRRALQGAADAASTAATWALVTELDSGDRRDSAVLQRVQTYAGQIDGASVSAVYTDSAGQGLSPAIAVGMGGTFPVNAAGVQVSVQKQIPTVLSGFVGTASVLTAATSAAALVPTASPSPGRSVIPVGVQVADFQAAMNGNALYDLFAPASPPAGVTAPVLDFAHSSQAAFAPGDQPVDYGYSQNAPSSDDLSGPSSIFTNLQYWSDGWHSPVSVILGSGTTVALAPATPLPNSAFMDPRYTAEQLTAYEDAVATGLQDQIRDQHSVDASGRAYGLLTVPLWDTSPSTGVVHVVAFARMRIRLSDVSSRSIRGQFVPYAVAAWGTPQAPMVDSGARLVQLVS